MDPRFRVEIITATHMPQQCIYAAMHQDYCEHFVADGREVWPDETRAGELVVKHLLAGERGHYGPLEHPSIVFNVGWFPHSVMQQARTHRAGVSFDVQSLRYTGRRIQAVADGELDVEEVFYVRPAGDYHDRSGKRYSYSEDARQNDLGRCHGAAMHYSEQVASGMAEEQARELIPYAIRQHFVVSFNVRSLLHFMDLRAKRDAQIEIQWLCGLMHPKLELWVPQISHWYDQARMGKAKLAP